MLKSGKCLLSIFGMRIWFSGGSWKGYASGTEGELQGFLTTGQYKYATRCTYTVTFRKGKTCLLQCQTALRPEEERLARGYVYPAARAHRDQTAAGRPWQRIKGHALSLAAMLSVRYMRQPEMSCWHVNSCIVFGAGLPKAG